VQSAATPPSIRAWIERRPWLLFVLVICVSLLITLPTLGELGLLSQAEIPAWKRARAANGAQLDGLLRSPALPDWLRAKSFALAGAEWGLRLPSVFSHALAGVLTLGLARRLGFGWSSALLAPLFLWAFPMVGLVSRAAESPVVAECFIAAAILAGLQAEDDRRTRQLGGLVLALLAAAAATASTGLAWGMAIPCLALGVAGPRSLGRPLRLLFGAIGLSAALVTLKLVLGQGEGYIPILGAAPDTYFAAQPHRRDLVGAFEEFGHQVFPFAILILLGILRPRRPSEDAEAGETTHTALPAVWLGLGLVLAVLWSAKYGRMCFPLAIPAALCCAAAMPLLFDSRYDLRLRRFALVMAVSGIWVMGKDAERTPSRIASPQHRFTNEKRFPAEEVDTPQTFPGWVRWAWMALILGYVLSPRSRQARRPGRFGDLPALSPEMRESLPWIVVGLALLHQSVDSTQGLGPASAEQLSVRSVFARHQAMVEAGLLPPEVGMQRVRDPGLELYGPDPETTTVVGTRKKLFDWLTADEPRVAFVRESDFAGIFQKARERDWALHVLDWSHHDLKLVANFVPDGVEEIRPLGDVVYDEPPKLEHETFVQFDKRIELIGWQIDGEVKRGGEVTVSLAFRVIRALPGSAKIYVRLQKERISKINIFPHEPANGMYPGNFWRKGDYIVDRFTFEIPSVNTLPGEHEFFVGIAKDDKKKLPITLPEGREGEFGVTLRGSKGRDFANLAKIDLR
jgi:hypothetical protein